MFLHDFTVAGHLRVPKHSPVFNGSENAVDKFLVNETRAAIGTLMRMVWWSGGMQPWLISRLSVKSGREQGTQVLNGEEHSRKATHYPPFRPHNSGSEPCGL